MEFIITSVGDGSVYIGNSNYQNLLGTDYPDESYVKCTADASWGYAPNYKWIIQSILQAMQIKWH